MRDFAIAATVCLATTFPLAAPAQAFTAQNGLLVQPDGSGFTVPWRGRSGASDFWCAAGDYAIRVLHLNPAEVIYRASPPKRRGGEAVRFTLDAAQSAAKTGLFVLGAKGGGITAGHAQSLCEFRKLRR